MKELENQRGTSLTSVLIAIGLTGVLGTIIMNYQKQQTQIQKRATVDQELNEAISLFRSMIIKKDTCNATLQGLKIPQTLDEVRFDYDESLEPFAEAIPDEPYITAKKFRGTKLVLRKMEVLETNPPSKLIVALDATFEKPSNTLGGQHHKKRFEIAVTKGTAKMITSNINMENVKLKCETDGGGQIADWETGEEAPEGSELNTKYIVKVGSKWLGFCLYPTKSGSPTIIVGCRATE